MIGVIMKGRSEETDVRIDELKKLGVNLRRLRETHNLTLAQLGRKAGCSIGYLSQVERGKVSPTISSFKKVAIALDANLLDFFDESKKPSFYLVKEQDREKLSNPSAKVIYELLKPNGTRGILGPLLVRFMPGAHSEKKSYSHSGEEFLFIIKGKLIYYLDNEMYILQKGDSIWYPASIDHGWKNPTNKETIAIRVTTPPSF